MAYSKVVADEYDPVATRTLDEILRDMGAIRLWRFAGRGGTQEVDFRWYWVRRRILSTRQETYYGLKLVGPAPLVEFVATALAARTRAT